MIVLLTILMTAGLSAPPSKLPTTPDLHGEIKKLEGELARDRIGLNRVFPLGAAAPCRLYTATNIAKAHKLLGLYVEAKTPEVLPWRAYVAEMYERCGTGPARPRLPPEGRPTPRPEVLPQTAGLEQAFQLYKDALMSSKVQEIARHVAKAYEDKYLQHGDEALLMQARLWREVGGERAEDIRDRHKALEDERFRKQPRMPPRPKIGRTGTENALRARF